ncbi:MAG: hypothetical protein ABSD44_06875 [Terracidiphilus sp.]
MRKPLGMLKKTIKAPLLCAAMLFLLTSPTLCRAQSGCTLTPAQFNQAPGTQLSFYPNVWPPGKSTVVTLFGSWTTPPTPSGCETDFVRVQGRAAQGGGNGVVDPNVTISNITYNADLTHATFTATVLPKAPFTQDLVTVACEGACPNYSEIVEYIVIPAPPPPPTPPPPPPVCPPTIASVTPDIWFAGKTYTATITGTGFNNQITCLALPLNITAADGTAVPYSSVSVDSDKKITLTGVAPPASDPTETACVTPGGVSVLVVRAGPIALGSAAANAGAASAAAPAPGTAGSTCTGQNGLLGITVQILGNQITCDPSMNCNPQDVISKTDGTDPPVQTVATGQQIKLKEYPDLPPGIKATKMTWTVDGTRIADYKPTTASASVKELQEDDLKKDNITYYWVYPTPQGAKPFRVTYKYCVDIPDVTDKDLKCSLEAKADFAVDGVDSPSINIWNEVLAHIDDLTGCDLNAGGPTLAYGNLRGPTPECSTPVNPTSGTPGITFYPIGTPPGAGSFVFAQLIDSDVVESSRPGATQTCNTTDGVDRDYPYAIDTASTSDSPIVPLGQNDTTVTRHFKATMYLLWQSTATAGSIPVPLGYIPWAFNAVANQVDGTWTASGSGAPVKGDGTVSNDGMIRSDGALPDAGTPNDAFVLAAPTQPNLGIPIWNGPAKKNPCVNE